MRHPSILLLVLAAAVPVSAEIEFTGYFVTGEKTVVALSDPETKASAWIAVGSNFENHVLTGFDHEKEAVTLSRDGRLRILSLKADAKVKEGHFIVSGTYSIGSEASMKVVAATLTIGAENVLPLASDVVLRITPEVMSDGNMRYRNSFEHREADGRGTVLSAPTVLARPNQAFSVKVGEYEYSFDPKSA
jgi:hypothetical protein